MYNSLFLFSENAVLIYGNILRVRAREISTSMKRDFRISASTFINLQHCNINIHGYRVHGLTSLFPTSVSPVVCNCESWSKKENRRERKRQRRREGNPASKMNQRYLLREMQTSRLSWLACGNRTRERILSARRARRCWAGLLCNNHRRRNCRALHECAVSAGFIMPEFTGTRNRRETQTPTLSSSLPVIRQKSQTRWSAEREAALLPTIESDGVSDGDYSLSYRKLCNEESIYTSERSILYDNNNSIFQACSICLAVQIYDLLSRQQHYAWSINFLPSLPSLITF